MTGFQSHRNDLPFHCNQSFARRQQIQLPDREENELDYKVVTRGQNMIIA